MGYWPAFWVLGAPYRGNLWNWPSVGEIDILENVQGFNNAWGTFHCGTVTGGPCQEKDGISAQRPCAPTSCQTGFHTYRLEWDRRGSVEELRWYLDGVLFHTVRSTQVDAATWQNATNHGYFIVLNVAIGGEFPAKYGGGPTADTASGHAMVVDYVAVWSAGGTPGPTPSASPAPSTSPTPSPGLPGGRDARTSIEAESYDAQSGLSVEDTAGGGHAITTAANGDWALYRGVRFGSTAATQFVARVASGACCGRSGLVEVRLDDRSNQPVATFAVADTGGWQSWRAVPANMSAVTGVHDVYLTFSSGQLADYVNVDWITFG
jgi:beta-glucanase (GH16 family)